MTEFILDYSKWRCGGDGHHKVGEGETKLKNPEGFMCCLGQAIIQISPSIKEEELLDQSRPEDLKRELSFLTRQDDEKVWDEDFEEYDTVEVVNDSSFSVDAIGINDNSWTTPERKIEQLTELFKEQQIELKVINKP